MNRSNGTLYAVWMDARFSTPPFRWDSIGFSRSNNGGATWSTPIRVNQTPQGDVQNSQAFTPSVHVLNNGTIAVSYYDFRFNDPEDPARLDTDHWTTKVPVWNVLQRLAADRAMASSIHLVDSIEEATKLVTP